MLLLPAIQIEKAKPSDYSVLTEIAFLAKRHWNYPESYYRIWQDELTVSKDYINQSIVYKALAGEFVVGFYSLSENKSDFYSGDVFVSKGHWLEHLFILPEYHNMGIGTLLMQHAITISKKLGISELLIFVDPYASRFYDKAGAEFLYNSKSSISGRMIPVYRLKIN
ncbi:GNAT family N-acetyltransferase [Saccharicrinis sp. FJH2]|uniref:GNAT family N-acetyltransferase n=1 Tax=Saccharicrinis sp. FJH65 TaxID=3344659 RepID=UPI0035F33293